MATTLPAPGTSDPKRLSELPPELALRLAAPILVRLARDPAFLDACVLPLLQEPKEAKDWYVAHSYEGQDGSHLPQIFVWPPGSRTNIHDHISWGAYCCVVGCVLEERYERLDDGSHEGYARLKKAWELLWRREDGVSTVLPYGQGIHRVGNPGDSTAISLHLYGPPMGEVDGRDYDPARDYVCDRVVAQR